MATVRTRPSGRDRGMAGLPQIQAGGRGKRWDQSAGAALQPPSVAKRWIVSSGFRNKIAALRFLLTGNLDMLVAVWCATLPTSEVIHEQATTGRAGAAA